jgi:hypothetical protein
MLALFFNPEDRADMFDRKVGWLSTEYLALYAEDGIQNTFSQIHDNFSKTFTNISYI